MASDVIDFDRREDPDTTYRDVPGSLSGTASVTATPTADSWRSQHARKVAERRERWEHERLQAEKLQQHLDHREAERRRRRDLYHIRSYGTKDSTDTDKLGSAGGLQLRSRRDGSDLSSSVTSSGSGGDGVSPSGSGRSLSAMQLVSQLNERKNQLEARVKELQRALQEERRNSELLRQSHKTNVEEHVQKVQKAEWELAQYKKNEEKWKRELESKTVAAAKVAQLEEDKMQLRSKLERQGSVRRKVEIIEQKAVELEKENLRLHSQLARELHRVKTEVDLRIAIQQEKLNLCAQLEEEREKGRVQIKLLEKEVERLSRKAQADTRDGEARLNHLENKLTNQVEAKEKELQEMKQEIIRLQQQLQENSSGFLLGSSRAAERCRSLGDVSNLEGAGQGQRSVAGQGASGGCGRMTGELRLFAERAYHAKAEAEQRFWESEKLRIKLKAQYREEIQFLRQMNFRLANNGAMANDSKDILEMIQNVDAKSERIDELEKQLDDLELVIGKKDSFISHLEWQLIDKESTIDSLIAQQRANGDRYHTQQLRRRPDYRSSSSMHSHLTTPTLVGCDSRQTLLASSDSMNSLTSTFNYDGYDYGDARTDAEKIHSAAGRSASANAYHSSWTSATTPSRLQPLRRTTSEGNSPVFGSFKGGSSSSTSRMYSSQASMDVAREALAVSRGLAQLMQSSESLDRGDGDAGNGKDDSGSGSHPQRSASADPFSIDDFGLSLNRPSFDLRLSGLHRRRLDDPGVHYHQSSGDSHPRQSSGETDLSSSMPPSPVSSCNTMITRSSASELHCSSSPEFIESSKPHHQTRFNGIPTRPIPLKGGSRSPLPQRPLSPRLRNNYFQPLTVAPISDSEDELGKLHSRQRSGSYESLRTESASGSVNVSAMAVKTLQARLEMFQRGAPRYSEQMSTTSGDSSIFELTRHTKELCEPAAADSDPEERERLGSSIQQYRVVQQPVVVQAAYNSKALRPSYRSSSVSSLEAGNLKATRC